VKWGSGLVEILDELPNSPLVEKDFVFAVALVGERDRNAGVEKRQLAQSICERRVGELRRLKDLAVGPKPDRRPRFLIVFERTNLLETVGFGLAVIEAVSPEVAVAFDLDRQRLRQRVDDADADAVEAAGDLIGFVVELSAGVEHSHNDLDGGSVVLFVSVDRDAAAVVAHRDGAVVVDRHLDVVTVARQRLVDGVVDDLINEMMEPTAVGRADIHRRPFADSLQALKDLDLSGSVVAFVCHRTIHP